MRLNRPFGPLLFLFALSSSLTTLPHSVPAHATGICVAADAVAFKQCVHEVNRGFWDAIEIADTIICSGPAACAVSFHRVNRPVTVYGRATTAAGFRRVDTYDYVLIIVSYSSQIRFINLTVDDTAHQPCDPVADGAHCRPVFHLHYSSSIVFDNVTTLHSKNASIYMYESPRVAVTSSRFINTYAHGVMVDRGSTTARIEGNLFKDIKSNALVIHQVASPSHDPLVVRGNTFIHNHRENIYSGCGNGTEPCEGGQILIREVTNLRIERNLVKDGSSDTNATKGTSGIEIDPENSHNVVIVNNDIHNHTGWGIYLNNNPRNIGHILVAHNKMYLNGLVNRADCQNICNFPAGPTMTPSENCYGSNCPAQVVAGVIYAEPNPCGAWGTSATCVAAVYWDTNDGLAPFVVQDGRPFGVGAAGSRTARIAAPGDEFALWDGVNELATVLVGVTPSMAPLSLPPALPGPVAPSSLLLSAPQDGTTLAGLVELRVDPVNLSNIARVDYFVDGAFLASAAIAPYAVVWDTRNAVPNTAHTIFARAHFGAGTIVSFPIAVTVADVTPPSSAAKRDDRTAIGPN